LIRFKRINQSPARLLPRLQVTIVPFLIFHAAINQSLTLTFRLVRRFNKRGETMNFRNNNFKIFIAFTSLCLAVAASGISAAAEEGKPPATGSASTAKPPVSGTIAVPPMPPDGGLKWPVSYEDAVKIASAYITPETLAQAKYYATQMGSGSSAGETHLVWEVVFVAQKVTKADLECKALAPEPYEPDHSYGTIYVRIDGTTGAFISKSASFTMPRPIPTDYPVNTPIPAMPPDGATDVPAVTGGATPGKVITAAPMPMPAPGAVDLPLITSAAGQNRDIAGAPNQPEDGIIPPEMYNEGDWLPLAATDNAAVNSPWWIAITAGALVVLLAGGYLTMSHRRAAANVEASKVEDKIK
jgi:hypothetical protein